MDDSISRRVAIDKINERQRKLIYCFGFENDMVKIMDIAKTIISTIPSAQPEIVRCKDCKYWINGHLCKLLSRFGSFETEADFYCGYAKRKTDEEVD